MEQTRYEKVLQELEKEFLILMTNYLLKLHEALHEEGGLEPSHEHLVNEIKQDCISMCYSNLAGIAFDDRSEKDDKKAVERLNLYPIASCCDEVYLDHDLDASEHTKRSKN